MEYLQTRFQDILGWSRKAFEVTDDKTHGARGVKFRDAKGFQLGQYFEVSDFVLASVYCIHKGARMCGGTPLQLFLI